MPPQRTYTAAQLQELSALRASEASYAASLSDIQAKILKQLDLEKISMQEEVALLYKNTDTREKALDIIRETKNITRDLAKDMADYVGESKKAVPYAAEIAGLQKQLYDIEHDRSGLNASQITALRPILESNVKILMAASEQRQQLERMQELHGSIEKILGLQEGTIASIGDKVKGFLLNPWTAIVALLGLAVAKFVMMQGASEDFRKNTGLVLSQSKDIEEVARNTTRAQRAIGVSYEDALKSADALYKTTGNTALINQKNVDMISEMAARLGVSVDDSAKFVGTLSLIGKSADDIRGIGKDMEALAFGYGVSVKDLMSDVANATGDAYSYLQKYPNEFAKTAAKSRALGLDMKKVADITNGLLDIETSIGDEMEANIITGKSINLDTARYYALIGDTGKALDSMIGQLGSVAEFQKLAPLAQQSLAKAVGMTTEELGKTLKLREKERAMTSDQKMLAEAQRKEQDRIAGVLTQTKQSVEAIVSDLASIFLPVIEMAKPIIGAIASGFRSLHDFFADHSTIATWTKWISIAAVSLLAISRVDWIGQASKLGTFFSQSVKFFGRAKPTAGLGSVVGTAGQAAPEAGGGALKGIGEFVKGISPQQMLAAGAAMILIAGAVFILAKAMQEFSTGVTWDGVLKGITAMAALVGAVALLGAIMTSGIGTIAILAGAAAILVIAGAMWVLGDAMQKIASSSTGIDELFKTLMMVDPVRLVAIGGALAAVGAGLSAMAVGGLAAGVVNTIFGNVGGAGAGAPKKDKMDVVIDKLDMLNETLKSKDFSVNMDGRKMNKQLAIAGNYGT